MVELTRRWFLGGLGAGIVSAPAIVRAASLMPVRAPKLVSVLPMPDLMQYAPGQLYAELAEITRKAFVPRLYAELYRKPSALALLWDRQVSANA
jgi:hypothetical protein